MCMFSVNETIHHSRQLNSQDGPTHKPGEHFFELFSILKQFQKSHRESPLTLFTEVCPQPGFIKKYSVRWYKIMK